VGDLAFIVTSDSRKRGALRLLEQLCKISTWPGRQLWGASSIHFHGAE